MILGLLGIGVLKLFIGQLQNGKIVMKLTLHFFFFLAHLPTLAQSISHSLHLNLEFLDLTIVFYACFHQQVDGLFQRVKAIQHPIPLCLVAINLPIQRL